MLKLFFLLAAFSATANCLHIDVVGNRTKGEPDDAPWLISFQLYPNDFAYCSATLIKVVGDGSTCTGWIVTAASCLLDLPKDASIIATLGNIHLDKDDDKYEIPLELELSEDDIHEDYDDLTNYNDIAVVRVKFSTGKKYPTCGDVPTLSFIDPKPSQFANFSVTFAGWGLQNEKGILPKQLYNTTIDIHSDLDCTNSYGPYVYNGSVMLCAGDEKRSPCSHDTGGPLTCTFEQVPSGKVFQYLCGIASMGHGCGDHKYSYYPGIFTKVASFIDWIPTKMSQNLLKFPKN